MGIEEGDSGDETEGEEGKAGQDAEGSGGPAQLFLGIMGIRDCRLHGGEPPAAPRTLVRTLAGPPIGFAQGLAQGGAPDTAILARSSQMELFSTSCHAGNEIEDISEKLKSFGRV